MQPPPPLEPTELERQVRKLRLEVRKLRTTVIVCTVAICAVLSVATTLGFQAVLILLAFVAAAALMLVGIAGTARLLADGWDAVSMRWQRARWLAERNPPDEPK